MPAWRGSTHASGTGPGRGGRETSAAVPAGGVRRGGARARRAWGRPRPARIERRPRGAARHRAHALSPAARHRWARRLPRARHRPLRPRRVDPARVRRARVVGRGRARRAAFDRDRRRRGRGGGPLGRPRAHAAARHHGLRARAAARGAPPAARRTVAAQRDARDRRARSDGVDVGRPPRVRGGPLARGPPVRRGRAGARGVTQSRAGAPHPAQRAHSGHRRGGARRRQRDHARGGPLVPRPRRATTYTIMGQHDRFRPGHARQRTLGRHGAGRRARAGRGRMHAAGRRGARRAPASQDPPMTRRRLATACALTALLAPLARFAPRGAARAQAYDLVLAGGRVLDPESGLDATRNVGVTSGRITAVTTELPAARETLDVRGLVVAPGFIDLHAHGQDSESYRYYAHDGVTTALELEIGTYPVAPWYAAREGRALINYGVTVGHPGARRALLRRDQSLAGALALGDTSRGWTHAEIPAPDLPRLDSLVERGLAEGALGIGFGIAYTPGASREEILRIFRVAARHGVPCFVHLRQGGRDPVTGGSVAALQEVIADAAATGASLHVVHVTSMGQRDTPLLLQLIRGARERGLDVTTEAYPYTAGSTALQSAVFDPGWQQRMAITYHDILYPPTGERLTRASFARLRRQGATVVIFQIPDSTVRQTLADSLVMVASDGISPHGHPRLAGTHARVLGRYVRDSGALSLQDAVRKMTLLPAQRLERVVPAMRAKGRVQVGADADLTVFDAARVVDRATYERPAQFSEGIVHVLVHGVFVVRNSASVAAHPGRPIRRGL